MQINISFISQTVPGIRYGSYNANNQFELLAPHRAVYSLLPITFQAHLVCSGGTLWSLGSANTATFTLACERGARVIICNESEVAAYQSVPLSLRQGKELIVMFDTKESLLRVAQAWRVVMTLPIVAITGSVGKTITKSMIASIFQADNIPVYTSSEDQVSLHGLALNMLHVTDRHAAAFFELGIQYPGQMAEYVALLKPTIGVITSVSASHLHSFGSVNDLADELRGIFSQFSSSQIGIVCGDYPQLATVAYQHPVVRFGLKYKNMITAKRVSLVQNDDKTLNTRCLFRIYEKEAPISIPGHHTGVLHGGLAAAAIAHFLHVPFEVIIKGLTSFTQIKAHFELCSLRNGQGVIVNDSTNANPESVKAALYAIHSMPYESKIAVLGDMPELGTKQYFWHRHVGKELIKTRSISQLILVGGLARAIGPVAPATMDVSYVHDWQEAYDSLHTILAPQSNLVLIKGASSQECTQLVERLV